jgi:hypothetical protein
MIRALCGGPSKGVDPRIKSGGDGFCLVPTPTSIVMPWLDPGIHVFVCVRTPPMFIRLEDGELRRG